MKVLILGDGLLGSELNRQTGWVVASRKRGNLPKLDDWEGYYNLVSEYDTVINCIAHTNSYSTDEKTHYSVNYRFAADLSDICRTSGKKLVHISTEFVYANNITPPTENDIPLPDNTWYAYTKLLADEYIKLTNSNFLICRELHKPYPFTYPVVWDIQTSGDTVNKIAELIIKLIIRNAQGVFNVGTGMKFLKELAPTTKVVIPPLYVPRDTRMNLEKLHNFLNG